MQGARLEQRLLGLLARGVIGADQQVADDRVAIVAKGGDRDESGKAAAVLADVGELVDVLDPARRLEHERLESRLDRGSKLGAQRLGTGDDFARIGDIGGSDLVEDIGGGVAEHPLGPHVEDLNDPAFVGGDAREVGAVEDRILEGSGLEERPLSARLRGDVDETQPLARPAQEALPHFRLVSRVDHPKGLAPSLASGPGQLGDALPTRWSLGASGVKGALRLCDGAQ